MEMDQLAQAQQAKREATRAAIEATSAVQIAEDALGRLDRDRETKLRRPVAHEGLDASLALVPGEFRQRVVERYPELCIKGVAGVSPQTLAELAALYLASTPEFAQVLHDLLDQPAPNGMPELLDTTAEEHKAEIDRAKAELAELRSAATAAIDEQRRASQLVSRLELARRS